MNPKHKQIINDNLEELIRVTKHLNPMVQQLLRNGVINDLMAANIQDISDLNGRLREFYLLMMTREPNAFIYLRDCLRSTGNTLADGILEAHIFGETKQIHPCDNNNNSNNDDGYVPEDVQLALSQGGNCTITDNFPNGIYRLSSKPRGHAFIVNIENTTGKHRRLGSDVDFNNVCKLFGEQLGYKIDAKCDLKRKEFVNAFEEFCNNPELSLVDSVVVFIMSHGETENIKQESINLIASDRWPINTNWIIDRILHSNFQKNNESLRKPKMFFFQACRGPLKDFGRGENLEIHDSSTRVDAKTNYTENYNRTSNDSNTNSTAASVDVQLRLMEDILIANSTPPGYFSKRDTSDGSWFVSLFCEIASKYASKYDVETILGMVDEKLRLKESEYGRQSIETRKIGLSKQIFFNPEIH